MLARRAERLLLSVGLVLAGCGGLSERRPTNEGAGANGATNSGELPGGSDPSSNAAGGGAVSGPSQNPPGSASSGGTSSGGPGNGGFDASSGEGGSSSGGTCGGEACQLAVEPAPRWVTRLDGYGRGPAWIRFVTGEQVYVGQGENYATTVLARATGRIIGDPQADRNFVATDTSGRWIVRQAEQDCVVLDEERTAFRFECASEKMVRFSADGAALAHFWCVSEQGGSIQLDVYDTVRGERVATTRANLPCLHRGSDWNALVDSQRRRTLFAHPDKAELYVFDWETQSLSTRAPHRYVPVSVDPVNHEGTILSLASSHDQRRLVSVGAADGLAWLDPDTLEVGARVPEVPFFNLFANCFCTYLTESPVAWSPADEIYATGRRGGGIQLRDATSQQTLGILEPPSGPDVIRNETSRDFGPALIQFSPDLRQLVALYPQYVVSYSLSR